MSEINEIKTLKPDVKEFPANGKIYRAHSRLTIPRWRKYLEIQAEFGMGLTLGDLATAFNNIFDKANAQKLADIAVMARDAVIGITQITERSPQALRLCALFLNYEGEDLNAITDEQIEAKVNDWTIEGYDVQCFFHLAVSTLTGFKESYEAATAIISKTTPKKKVKTILSDTMSKESSI